VSFNLPARKRFLARLERGYTLEDAAAAAGTSRATVARWLARGRAPGAPPAHREFTKRFDAIRAAEDAEPQEPPHFGDEGYVDAMTYLEPARMAELADEQRQHAREVFVAHFDAHPPAWQTAEEWQDERARILSGTWDWQPADGERAGR
jgi:transcriptional regulator with XRE-family HTH domain